MTIGVATTTVSYKCNGREELAWLIEAEEMIEHAREAGHDLKWFVALEQDARGDEPFQILLEEMDEMLPDYTVWRYSLDDNDDVIDTHNRLIRICMGRNLCQDWATRDPNMSHLLFLDSDTTPEADCIPKLLALNVPVAGGLVPVYGGLMDGPGIVPFERAAQYVDDVQEGEPLVPSETVLARIIRNRSAFPRDASGDILLKEEEDFVFANPFIPMPEGWPEDARVKEHWNTAGFLLVRRDAFTRVAWNYDPDSGNSDDPAFQRNCAEMFGHQTFVRHDVLGHHVPGAVGAEQSHSEESRRVVRDES